MEEAKARTAARGWVTRAANNLSKLFHKENVSRVELIDALSEFDKRVEALDSAQSNVELVIDISELEGDIDNAAAFREKARIPKLAVLELLDKLSSATDAAVESVHEGASGAGSTSHKLPSTARLPKLELPKFGGDVTEWQAFWDKFRAIVHESDLPDISKFTYLQALLEGEAKAVVQGLSITAVHYSVACELLEKRFGRPERIVFAHIQSLLNITVSPTTKQRSRVTVLWKLFDELQAHVRSLEALDVTGSQYGLFLTPVIVSRLPQDIRMEWAREGEGRESDLDWLLTFLQKEIKRQERSDTFRTETRPITSEEKRVPTTAALQTTSESCYICGHSHVTDRCWDLTQVSIDDRTAKIRKAGLCFRCLQKGHIAKHCVAKCSKCNGRHHQLCCRLSDKRPKKTFEMSNSQNVHNVATENVSHVGVSCSTQKMCTILQTAQVKVSGVKGVTTATVLFDSGSDQSYVSSSLVKRVGPEWLTSKHVTYAAFGGKSTPGEVRNVYNLRMQGLNGRKCEMSATEVKVICLPLQRPKIPQELLNSCDGLQLADQYDVDRSLSIDILVGLDCYWQFFKSGVMKISQGLVAQETVFGWLISGSGGTQGLDAGTSTPSISHSLLCLSDVPDCVFRKFWELESVGVGPDSVKDSDSAVHPVLQSFNEAIEYKNGRYEVALPWKSGVVPSFPGNEKMATGRLNSLSKKLDRDPSLKSRYNAALGEMETNGVIVEVPVEEMSVSHPVYYMPHHPVVREASLTTKVRPVFDASCAAVNGVSLNDCLHAGPSLIPSLVEILLRFRRWKVAITGDITKAFLQIGVRKEDQDAHRFLWQCGDSVRVMRFQRVPFGNKSSPFLLNATIKYHLSQTPASKAVEELDENLYVDDWLSGCDTDTEACDLFREANEVMLKAGMSLAKCTSNNKVVSGMLFKEFESKYLETESLKILGSRWLSQLDCFSFDGIDVPVNLTTTKRVVLSFIARLFDPLGFLTPFVMTAKVLIQEIWQLGVEWDEELPETFHVQFVRWVAGLGTLREWEIPRCYFSRPWSSLSGLELHVFGDASEKGYGAVAFLRAPLENGKYEVSFVTSRARVAPLKKVTLPRLELLGALLVARLVTFVCKALKLPNVVYRCWSDSQIVLGWIKGDASRWKPFVANRVIEIQELTDPATWSHCSGEENPADLLSRGMFAEDLIASKLWLKGPSFLSCSVEGSGKDSTKPQAECSEELVSQVTVECAEELVSQVTVTVGVQKQLPAVPVLDIDRWGSLIKAIRVAAYVLRFLANLKSPGYQRQRGNLTYQELSVAKVKLFNCVQQLSYPTEIEVLKRGQSVSRNSPIASLNPFIGKDNLLRVKGRLQMADLSYEEKHPIIIPRGHLALLLVRFQHVNLQHSGVDVMVSSLRNSYVIIGLRRLAKRVKRECVRCQKIDARACDQPVAPLPGLRVQQAPPFTVTGLDYAGPLFCGDLPGQKLYILLFTCAVVRAVHLELTSSLSLPDFVLALRRFSARRGLPTILYSDNARTFKGAETLLLKLFGPLSPKWKFIVPRSPWWGGWWERLVRSVKSALKKSVGTRCLSRTELETTLCEIEACINSRPLTFVSDQVDYANPLTPSHFLIGKQAGFQIEISESQQVVTSKDLSERELFRQQRLDQFWSLWSKNYLRNLPPTVNKAKAQGELGVGSVVLVREDNLPRMKWPLGLVTALYPGKDGIVRSVHLQTARGQIVRSIQRLHDLEVNSCVQTSSETASSEVASSETASSETASSAVTSSEVTSSDNQMNRVVPESVSGSHYVTRSGRVVKPAVRLDL